MRPFLAMIAFVCMATVAQASGFQPIVACDSSIDVKRVFELNERGVPLSEAVAKVNEEVEVTAPGTNYTCIMGSMFAVPLETVEEHVTHGRKCDIVKVRILAMRFLGPNGWTVNTTPADALLEQYSLFFKRPPNTKSRDTRDDKDA